jgi:hypothetical protein
MKIFLLFLSAYRQRARKAFRAFDKFPWKSRLDATGDDGKRAQKLLSERVVNKTRLDACFDVRHKFFAFLLPHFVICF